MNLAAQLAAARGSTLAAENAVVDLIYQLFPDWTLLFPVRRSWLWTPPSTIEVWGANETEDAVRALLQAGFTGGVTIHSHRAERFLSCVCRTYPSRPLTRAPVDLRWYRCVAESPDSPSSR